MNIKKLLSLIGATAITASGGVSLMAMSPYPSFSSSSIINKNATIDFNTKDFCIKHSILEDELLFDCKINFTEELGINSLDELKENFTGFYFKNFNMFFSVLDQDLNQDTYKVIFQKPNGYYHFISLSDKEKDNFNLKFYKYNPNINYEVEIIYNLNFIEKNGNFYLNMSFRVEGYSENNNSIKLFIEPEKILTFIKNV
ncbi:hypothetical protein SKUN_001229 [Spiroplasma kunkelii CR2-3x]|uniref:Uncharacterized protein n=1 Tax=Spiroplasma kunkelii CR2-3x TaxID=273035 RepID=A0A0K2JHN5_SPIKU|nr:hypothetical protein [Spiroplasma kunkelii]ALA98104.1 hypothetical protein SKUN_001229 [Spiroplasma kunkelii CR2-3x]